VRFVDKVEAAARLNSQKRIQSWLSIKYDQLGYECAQPTAPEAIDSNETSIGTCERPAMGQGPLRGPSGLVHRTGQAADGVVVQPMGGKPLMFPYRPPFEGLRGALLGAARFCFGLMAAALALYCACVFHHLAEPYVARTMPESGKVLIALLIFTGLYLLYRELTKSKK